MWTHCRICTPYSVASYHAWRRCQGPELPAVPALNALKIEVPAFSRSRRASSCALLVVFLLLSVSFICICACVGLLYRSAICACVPYDYPFCVSGAEHGAANNRNYGQLGESFAGDAVYSAIIVWTGLVCTDG